MIRIKIKDKIGRKIRELKSTNRNRINKNIEKNNEKKTIGSTVIERKLIKKENNKKGILDFMI